MPEPPPLTVIVAPEQALTYCLAAASTSGWRAVEPAAVMPRDVGANEPDGAAALAAGAGVAAVPQAAIAMVAATASTPKRRFPMVNVVPPERGLATGAPTLA